MATSNHEVTAKGHVADAHFHAGSTSNPTKWPLACASGGFLRTNFHLVLQVLPPTWLPWRQNGTPKNCKWKNVWQVLGQVFVPTNSSKRH